MNDLIHINYILQKMKTVFHEPIELHSGNYSKVKYEIDRLTDEHLIYLAKRIPKPDVDRIVSVGGGMRFAKIISQVYDIPISLKENFSKIELGLDKILIVDDVMTTGESINSLFNDLWHIDYEVEGTVCALVIVKRGDVKLPFPLFSFFQVPSDYCNAKKINTVKSKKGDLYIIGKFPKWNSRRNK